MTQVLTAAALASQVDSVAPSRAWGASNAAALVEELRRLGVTLLKEGQIRGLNCEAPKHLAHIQAGLGHASCWSGGGRQGVQRTLDGVQWIADVDECRSAVVLGKSHVVGRYSRQYDRSCSRRMGKSGT